MSAVDDVEAVLGRDLTSEEAYRVVRLIDLAAGAIAGALPGIWLTPGSEVVEIRAHDNEFWTPKYPVTAINSIKLGEGTLGSTSYEFTDRGHVTFGERSILNAFEINLDDLWRFGDGLYTVDYDFGFVDPPVDIASAIAELVAARLTGQATNPGGVESESLGAYSVTYGRNGVDGFGVSDSLRYRLRYWRRTREVSVPLVP